MPKHARQIGAVFIAPISYVDGPLQALGIVSVDPFHKMPPGLRLQPVNDSTFDHPPVKEFIGLEYNEGLLVYKAKVRPVILFSVASRTAPRNSGSDETFLCLPIFGLDQFPPEFVQSVKAFKYINRFYLPSSVRPKFEEGMIRFDRTQVVHTANLKRRDPPIRLTPDAIYVLQEWFRYYVTGVCEDFVLEHQKIELEKLATLLGQKPK